MLDVANLFYSINKKLINDAFTYINSMSNIMWITTDFKCRKCGEHMQRSDSVKKAWRCSTECADKYAAKKVMITKPKLRRNDIQWTQIKTACRSCGEYLYEQKGFLTSYCCLNGCLMPGELRAFY